MARYWKNKDDFLSLLNDRVFWEDGEIHGKYGDCHDQQSLPLDTQKQFIFTQEVDLVIQGYCSDRTGWKPTDEFPMGKLIKVEGEPDRSFLHAVIADEKPKTVLLFSDCCGSYSLEYKNMLRRLFPEITWLIPTMDNLYNNFPAVKNAITATYWLMKAGIIGPEV